MQTEDQQALQTAGLAHIVAVSGAHVSIFLAFLGVILQFIKNEKIKYTAFILLAFLNYGNLRLYPISCKSCDYGNRFIFSIDGTAPI